MWMDYFAVNYSDRLVFAYLISLAANGELFTICYVDIAAATGINQRTIQRAIPRLTRAGFITCERAGRGRPHTYKVNTHEQQHTA